MRKCDTEGFAPVANLNGVVGSSFLFIRYLIGRNGKIVSVLMYTTDHIFPVLLVKDLINEDGVPTKPHKLATGAKPSVSHLRVLFCSCVVRKATAHVEKKALNMRHQAQKGFCGIFVGIPEHQKGYLVYVPSTRKIIYSYDVVFDEIFLVR